ncbi:hypothetical protein ANN_22391 [Periplaneta americana]|uniref:Transposase n=1 Tax=Periplaneta americana TaxID=6978 RepID=A0ABQ8S836_PERAM|nr:hypothetical protein ANN_22391 [Periplaneta americana]
MASNFRDSQHTVRRRFSERGIRCRRAVRREHLTMEHAVIRLLSDRTSIWRNVIFSDEVLYHIDLPSKQDKLTERHINKDQVADAHLPPREFPLAYRLGVRYFSAIQRNSVSICKIFDVIGLHRRRSLSAAAPSERESRLTAHRKAYVAAGEMSPGSSTESYPAFAHIGLRENPGKNLNQVTCPDRESNSGHLVSRPDALTVTPQVWTGAFDVAISGAEGLLLVDIMPHGTTINSDAYVATLKKLQARLSRVRRHREK